MADRTRALTRCGIALLVAASITTLAAQSRPNFADHPLVGSWFGKAVQLCPAGVAPAACAGGNPAVVLFMTPTVAADGTFLGNDSLDLLSPPLGPHTTAHGGWIPTSRNGFRADYVLMLGTFPKQVQPTISAVRFRWAGEVISADTAVGFVNAYFQPPLPLTWSRLSPGEFPGLPREADALVTSPPQFYTDPGDCRGPACPLVFKFTIKRVRP